MKNKSLFLSLLLMSFLCITSYAQSIEELVSKYTGDNGKEYMQPFANYVGASLNSGLYHTAHIKKMGFQMYLGIQATAAFIPDKYKTFTATTEGSFTPVQTADVSTIFGPSESTEVSGDGGTVYVFPGGLNVSMMPLAMPQLTIGSVYGTDLTIRYFGYNFGEDFGKLRLFGIGVRHSISQYVTSIPLDIAAGFYYQTFKLGDLIDANTWSFNAQASKTLLIFTFYGGLGYEHAKVNIAYFNEEADTDVEFRLKGENNIRLTAGINFNLGPVKLNVDYSLAKQSILCVGLGIGINEK